MIFTRSDEELLSLLTVTFIIRDYKEAYHCVYCFCYCIDESVLITECLIIWIVWSILGEARSCIYTKYD